MRLAAWGTLSCVLAMGMADFTPFAQTINAGALTVLGWMIWYLLTRAFPAHIRAQKEDRQAFLDALNKHAELNDTARKHCRRSLIRISSAVARLKDTT